MGVSAWLTGLKLKFNPTKTEFPLIRTKLLREKLSHNVPCLILGQDTNTSASAKNLGVVFDSCLNVRKHISQTCSACFYHIRDLRQIPHDLVVPILKRLHWLPVKFRIHFKICAITIRTLKVNQTTYLAALLVRLKCSKYLRFTNSNRFFVPRIKIRTGSRAFSISGPALWNALPVSVRNAKTILTFRKLLKSHQFDLAFPL